MLIVACVSSHGFGHGARVAAVLRALHQLEPRCRFVLSSALPEAFVARSFAGIPLVQLFRVAKSALAKSARQKAAEEKAAEQKAAEQEAAEQKDAE